MNQAKDGAEQFVILGAGLDTRAYNDMRNDGLQFFELDQASTQQLKRKSIQKAGIDASHVHFVEVDFAQDDWFAGVESAGYDPNKRTIFLWEGVTLYLGETSVRNMLRRLKANAVAGSVIVLDIYSTSFVSGEYMPGMKATMPLLAMTDEQLSFGLDMTGDHEKSLDTFVSSEGMAVDKTFIMGYKSKKGTWMVVAELKI